MKCALNIRTLSACAAIIAPAALVALVATSASANATSPNFAGWTISTPRSSAEAATIFKVPTLTCTSTNATAVAGVGIPTSSSVIASGVALSCSGGAASYTAETDINGTVTTLPVTVKPGDRIVTSLTVGAHKISGVFKDTTKSFSTKITGSGGAGLQPTVGVDGSETSTTDNPVPDFGKVVFLSSKIDEMTISASGAQGVDMATSTGTLQIRTDVLNAAGDGFTAKFIATG